MWILILILSGMPLTWFGLILIGEVDRKTSGDDLGMALAMCLFWPITLVITIVYFPLYMWPIAAVEYVKEQKEISRKKKVKLREEKDAERFVPEGYKRFELFSNEADMTNVYRSIFSRKTFYVFIPTDGKDFTDASFELWINSNSVAHRIR